MIGRSRERRLPLNEAVGVRKHGELPGLPCGRSRAHRHHTLPAVHRFVVTPPSRVRVSDVSGGEAAGTVIVDH